MWIAPGGHPRQLHAVLNDVVKFPVAEILRRRRPQIGHSRIKIQPQLRLPASVNAVTRGTLGHKQFPALFQAVRRNRNRILRRPLPFRNRQPPSGCEPGQSPTPMAWS